MKMPDGLSSISVLLPDAIKLVIWSYSDEDEPEACSIKITKSTGRDFVRQKECAWINCLARWILVGSPVRNRTIGRSPEMPYFQSPLWPRRLASNTVKAARLAGS